jgi:hypothetical protein
MATFETVYSAILAQFGLHVLMASIPSETYGFSPRGSVFWTRADVRKFSAEFAS